LKEGKASKKTARNRKGKALSRPRSYWHGTVRDTGGCKNDLWRTVIESQTKENEGTVFCQKSAGKKREHNARKTGVSLKRGGGGSAKQNFQNLGGPSLTAGGSSTSPKKPTKIKGCSEIWCEKGIFTKRSRALAQRARLV